MKAPLRLLILHHPLGAAPGLGTWRPNADRDHHQLHAALRERALRSGRLKPYMVDDRRPQHGVRHAELQRQQRPEHARGRVSPSMMTGVPALGKIGQQDHVGGRRVDRSAPARQFAAAGRADADDQDAVRIAAAGRGRALRPRRGGAARALVPAAARRTKRHRARRRQPLYPETQPLNVYKRVFGGLVPTGTDPAQDPGAEAVGARLHARRPGADADADSRRARRTGWRRTPTPSRSSRRACGRRTASMTGQLRSARSRRCRPTSPR